MFNQSYEIYITPLVINNLGRGHTHTGTHTHTQMNTHTDDPHRINFKKPGARRLQAGVPGLIILISNSCWLETKHISIKGSLWQDEVI